MNVLRHRYAPKPLPDCYCSCAEDGRCWHSEWLLGERRFSWARAIAAAFTPSSEQPRGSDRGQTWGYPLKDSVYVLFALTCILLLAEVVQALMYLLVAILISDNLPSGCYDTSMFAHDAPLAGTPACAPPAWTTFLFDHLYGAVAAIVLISIVIGIPLSLYLRNLPTEEITAVSTPALEQLVQASRLIQVGDLEKAAWRAMAEIYAQRPNTSQDFRPLVMIEACLGDFYLQLDAFKAEQGRRSEAERMSRAAASTAHRPETRSPMDIAEEFVACYSHGPDDE